MLIAMYQATAEHWAHAEQVRWTMLYNYLMANTILLLAWSTIFVSKDGWTRSIALVVLCLAGTLIGLVWVSGGMRASDFVDMYGKLGASFEQHESIGKLFKQGPFSQAWATRKKIQGFAGFVTTRGILKIVPGLFVVLYLILAALSLL